MKKKDVLPFDENFERLRKKTTGADFEFSLKHLLKSTATTKFPTFVQGTLPKQYESCLTVSVKKMKKTMGNALWLKDFANNRERHNRMHGSHDGSLVQDAAGGGGGGRSIAANIDLYGGSDKKIKGRRDKLPMTPTMEPTQAGTSC